MPETDKENLYKVEYGENYVLTPEQTKKLIWQKIQRNLQYLKPYQRERESRLNAD